MLPVIYRTYAVGPAWPMNGQATGTKATCVAWTSPPGTLWVPGFVAVAEGFSPTLPARLLNSCHL